MSSHEEPVKNLEKLSISSIITLSFIILTILITIPYFINFILNGNKNNVFSKLKDFYGESLTNISIALIIAFLVSNVISSFNIYFMTPLVQSIFPGEDIWQSPINLPRDKVMYPGLLLQSFIGFILSIGILFVIYFLINKLFNLFFGNKSKDTQDKIINIIIYGFILIIYLFLLIWNAYDILKPKIDETDTSSSSSQNQQRITNQPENQQLATINSMQRLILQKNQPFIPLNQVYIPPNYKV